MPLCDTAGHKRDSPCPAGSPQGRFFQRSRGQHSERIFGNRCRNSQQGQRPGTGVFAVYLQTAQAELLEAVSGRKEVAEKDCGEVGLAEKSKAAAGEKVNKEKMICKMGGVLFGEN